MLLNFFKHKKEETPRTFEGRFISDEELKEMTKPKSESFIKKEMKEIEDMMEKVKQSVE